jgi:D-aminoacyl-tRNA deacylase
MVKEAEKLGLILSLSDPVGAGCFKKLLATENFGEIAPGKLYENARYRLLAIEGSLLEVMEEMIEPLKPISDLIFLSKHAAESGRRTLTVHTTGNWGKEAKFGGKIEELSFCNPFLMKNLILGLKSSEKPTEYEISLEVTHHGPTSLSVPLAFIELGSNETAWKDEKGQESLINVIKGLKNDKKGIAAIGFGGGHYAPVFNSLILDDKWAIGHIGPKYTEFSQKTIEMAFKRTKNCEKILLDKKGLRKEQKDLIIATCEKNGFSFELF